jgi:hypothetical protein
LLIGSLGLLIGSQGLLIGSLGLLIALLHGLPLKERERGREGERGRELIMIPAQ